MKTSNALKQHQVEGFGGGGCFPGSVLIMTPGNDGAKAIKDLAVGDEVLSFDAQGKVHVSRVTVRHIHSRDKILKVNYWGGSFRITGNHWVLNQYNRFVEIRTLTEHDALVDKLGHLCPIISFEDDGEEAVYNLTVEPNHTFIADGIRVHNGGRGLERPRVEGAGGGGGGKGGGGSTRAAVEDPNSLVSHQYANVIDLLSEGPIVGLIDGLKSVYLDGVPIMNAGGTYNFQGVTLDTTLGTQAQSVLPAANWAGAEVGVGTRVQYGVPVTRHIDASGQTRVRVTLEFPQMTYQNTTTGDLHGHSVAIAIYINNNGGGWNLVKSDTISGKCVSKYQRAYMLTLPGNGPWDIKVERVSADDAGSNYRSQTWWSSYTEIVDDKFNYPNSALVGISVDSQYFTNIPARGYHIKGLQIKIPSNYNPLTRVYTGVWDGTFAVAWTNNPAWCFYDLLTNTRYGLGKYISIGQVDKWTLYSIAQYCDQLVDNGFGGVEPRFTCNLYLQTQAEAYKVIANMASIFRAMIYWASNQIVPVQDAPNNVAAIYSPANVLDGKFTYQGSSLKARHTVALVTWNDPEDQYRQKVEYVPLRSAIKQFGVIEMSVTAFGCISRGQAHRFGLWALITEQINNETVTFGVGLDGILSPPGSVIKVNDPSRQVVRFGGRVISATTTAITIDNGVSILAGKTYTLSCMLTTGVLETKTLTNLPGVGVTVLTPNSAYSAAPASMAMWALEQNDLKAETWRVLSIQEGDNNNTFEITALAHNADLFTSVDTGVQLSTIPSTQPVLTKVPEEVLFSESIYPASTGTVGIALHVSWKSNAQNYIVSYRETNGNWTHIPSVQNNVDITGLVTGMVYNFIITAIDVTGLRLPTTQINYTVIGENMTPPQVTNLVILGDGEGADVSIKWDQMSRTDSYSIEVRTLGILRRTISTTNLTYTYTDQDQKEDGTQARAVNMRIWSVNNSGRCTAYSEVTGGNTAPAQLTGVNAIETEAAFVIYYTPPSARDWAGCLVHLGTSTVTPSLGNLVYDGKDSSIVIAADAAGDPLVLGTTYFFQIAAYDTYGKAISDLNYLAASGTVTLIGTTGGVPVVSSLPITPGPTQEVVLLSTDHKLYRWNGSAYICTTDGADLLANSVTAGKITVADLSTINANMGHITAGDMTLNSAGWIKGGQSAWNTGYGYWLGYDTIDGKYKFSIANANDDKMTFDDAGLNIQGNLTVNALPDQFVTLNGSFDNLSGWFADDDSAVSTEATIVSVDGDNRVQPSAVRIYSAKFAVLPNQVYTVEFDVRSTNISAGETLSVLILYTSVVGYSYNAVTEGLRATAGDTVFLFQVDSIGAYTHIVGDPVDWFHIVGSFVVPDSALFASIAIEVV